MYHFLGDVTAVRAIPGGVEVQAGTPRLRVRGLRDGIFQVRLHQHGKPFDDPPSSYAVDPSFLEATAAHVSPEDDGDTIRLDHGSARAVLSTSPLRIHFEDEDGTTFAADRFGPCWEGDAVGLWKKQVDGEQFYGLGEKASRLNRTNETFENWNTDAYHYQPGTDPLYTTIPFYLGLFPDRSGHRRAYGLYVDNTYRTRFDFGVQAPGCASMHAEGGELAYYLIPGPTVADVLRRYTAMTGRTPMPPRWALGYHQSRWSYYPEREIRRLVQQFRDRDIPLDVLHVDIHYMDGYRIFTWDPERFPDPAGLLRSIRAQGVQSVVIVDPGVKVEPGYAIYEEGLDADLFVTYPDGTPYTGRVWPGDCHFPDFTNPNARTWFARHVGDLLADGVAGIWTDMNEPSVGPGETMPDVVQHDLEGRGGTHREAHNVYGLLMARSTYEALRDVRPEGRPFVLTRSGFAGVQRYASVWTGDNTSDWDHLRLAPPMLLSLGLSGVPFSGSDVGGFSGTPTPELFARWMQLGAVSPLFRTHSAHDTPRQEPWSFGPEVEDVARRYVRLRYRLLPLFYTLFYEHTRTGLPILRPLLMHYMQDERFLDCDDQFLLGRQVLVAPVLQAGVDARRVLLPAEVWFDFWTGRRYEGPGELLTEAPLDTMPLFVRGGTTLPLAPPRPFVDAPPHDTLQLRVYAGTGTSMLYEDDGTSRAYEQGMFRRTTFAVEASGEELTLTRSTEGSYPSPVQRFTIRLYGVDRPETVTVDGRPYERYDDAADVGALELHVPAAFDRVTLRGLRA